MKNIKVLFIYSLIVFSFITVKAQHIISVSNIDMIAYDDGVFMLYEKVAKDSFKEIDISFSSGNRGFSKFSIDRDGYTYSQEQLVQRYKTLLFVHTLKSNGFNDLKDTEWLVKTEEAEPDERYIFKFTATDFAAYNDLESLAVSGKLGAYESSHNYITDNPSQWDIFDQMWYQPVILDFGNDKHIVLLNDGSNIDFTFIPLIDKTKVLSEDVEIQEILPIEKNTFFVNQYNQFNDFDFSDLYKKIQDDTKKYRLFDHYGNDLLGVNFDTIMHNEYYIVGKKDTEYTIYTSLLEKLEISGVKKVYFSNNELEILTDKGAHYYTHLGLISETTFMQTIIVCGTVNSIQYELITDQSEEYNHAIKITHGGFASQFDESKKFIFTDIKNKYIIRFLDDTSHQYWDENEGKQSKYPAYIKVRNGAKYGLKSYEYDMFDGTFSADTIYDVATQKRKVIYEIPAKITTKAELPMKYDEIKINRNGLILFYKKDKLGVFPQQKKPQYELLESVTASFYKILKNGKSGWLDIKTMEEFFF
jgi:hypothetical protein